MTNINTYSLNNKYNKFILDNIDKNDILTSESYFRVVLSHCLLPFTYSESKNLNNTELDMLYTAKYLYDKMTVNKYNLLDKEIEYTFFFFKIKSEDLDELECNLKNYEKN